ncbi:MAG TPA: hypothetical protein VKT82_09465 [Ktedonobacterales bacterium]|nr:hypothetical protein [Ktedonobacterales bacterium]
MSLDCEACGKQHIPARYPVLRVLPDGQYEELGVCAECKPQFQPVETLFVRESAPPYTQDQRPPFWENGASLRWHEDQGFATSPVAPRDYPLIEDFEVLLEGVISKHRLGKAMPYYMAWLFSPSRGYLTYILGADELEDLCRPDFTLPPADFAHPYHDIDQNWHVLLAEDDEYVYILAGGRDGKPLFDMYHTWFKVEKNRYYQQWEQAVHQAHSLAAGLTEEA